MVNFPRALVSWLVACLLLVVSTGVCVASIQDANNSVNSRNKMDTSITDPKDKKEDITSQTAQPNKDTPSPEKSTASPVQSKSDIKMLLIGAAMTLFSTLIAQYFTTRQGLKNQIAVSDYQKRQQTYAQLKGRKFMLTQTMVSRMEAYIFSDFHERKWHLTGDEKDSIDLKEAMRWMTKSEDLAMEIARNNLALFESVGNIEILFKDNTSIRQACQRVYNFKTIAIKQGPQNLPLEALEAWKLKAVADVQLLVEEEYGKPIDALLVAIDNAMPKAS